MAHYAILDKDKIVTQVIVGKDENEPLPEGYDSWEQYYGGVRTSYNTFANEHKLGGTPFRGNYAGIGYKYDSNYDLFIPLRPFPSWWFDYEAAAWKAPVPDPSGDGKYYKWDEQNKTWVEFFPPQAE